MTSPEVSNFGTGTRVLLLFRDHQLLTFFVFSTAEKKLRNLSLQTFEVLEIEYL